MDPRLTNALALVVPLVVFTLAIGRGGAVRTAGVAVGLAWIASALVTPFRLTAPSLWLAMIDALLAIWLVRMTVLRRPAWLIFTAACACLLVVNHIVFAIHLGVLDWAFFSVGYIWSAGVLLGLVWGAFSAP